MTDLLYFDLTYKIRGAAFEVYNSLGYGHKEIVYQRALAKELESRKIPFLREPRLNILFKGEKIGLYIPDFLIGDSVVIELKSLEFMPQKLTAQLLNYMKGTNYKVGLMINFGGEEIQIIRRVWTNGSV